MKKLFYLFLLFCITAIIIFSCSKSIKPDPGTLGTVTPDSLAKQCVNVALISPKGTDSQTVGLNVPITPIKYKISNNQSSDTTGLAEVSVSAIGLPPGITTNFSGAVLTISGATAKDSSSPYVYIIVASGNKCTAPLTGVISLKPCATISRTSASSTFFQVVPSNTTIAPITFKVGGGGTGATVTGLPAGITGNFSAGVVTVSGTLANAPDSTYLFKVITQGGAYCNVYDSGFIEVTTCPVVTLTSPVGTDYQTVAVNQAIQTITYSVTGHYSTFSVDGFPPGVNAVINGGTITITGAPTQKYGNGQGPVFEYVIQVTPDMNNGYCGPLIIYGNIAVQ